MEKARLYSAETPRQKAVAIGAGEAALWGRLLNPAGTELSSEAARYILALRFPQPNIDRMHELAEKARAGTLTPEE